MIKILVVDDHPVVREGLVALLEDESDFRVVASVGTAEEAIQGMGTLLPDVVLLDLELPGMDGVSCIDAMLKIDPQSKIVVFTAYDTDERVFGSIRAGATGYLLKGAGAAEIAQAVRVAHAGESYLQPRIAAKLLSEVTVPHRSVARLTMREQAVLRLVAAGLPNKQIARDLSISERTVKFHVTSIMRKLDADNRTQAVTNALHRGVL